MTSRSSSISDIAVVVAHHSRLDQAYGLAGRVGAAHVSVDYESRGARWGHCRRSDGRLRGVAGWI